MLVYHLISLSMCPAYPDQAWYESALKSAICPDCRIPKVPTLDVVLEADPDNVPLNIITGVGMGVIRQDLLDALGQQAVNECLLLGRILRPTGDEVARFVTFRGRERTLIRGDSSSIHRRCSLCGSLLYTPMGKWYVIERELGRAPISESQLCQLVISEEIHKRVSAVKWRKLGIQKLPVVAKSKDGLDEITLA